MAIKRDIKKLIAFAKDKQHYLSIYKEYSNYTMITEKDFIGCLKLVSKFKNIKGDVIECGVWRGGMSAGIATVLGKDRAYFLFDSFEGLPEAKEIDGVAAKKWQDDKSSPTYFNNCSAEMSFAETAMKKSGVKFELIKGWFKDSLPAFTVSTKIAVLRLDGDWYDSTMDCLVNLYPKVEENGVIIIDDYYAWDGCAKAVHDYLSRNQLPVRIAQTKEGICYIVKTSDGRKF
jgi:O-methyltransferase